MDLDLSISCSFDINIAEQNGDAFGILWEFCHTSPTKVDLKGQIVCPECLTGLII